MHDSSHNLRRWITLCEAEEDDAFNREYENDTRFDHLPSSASIARLKPQIAAVAQNIYDKWTQGGDYDELNGGGICHLIAEEVANILGNADIPVATQCRSDVQHVSCIAQLSDGVYEIDVPYWLYEKGGGFTWSKLPDIQFTPDDVMIHHLDGNPANMSQYVEEWEDE